MAPRSRGFVAALLAAGMVSTAVAVDSPFGMCAALEARMAAGEGVLLPDADAELVRHAGTIDLAEGDWPAAFHAHAGETICVAVSPLTGCYEFFDESGECFFTLVPVLPTTENWVAPFRHAEAGTHPDDDLYAPWRLVDVWTLSHAEFAESESHAENAEIAETSGRDAPTARSPLRRGTGPGALPANLCFAAFSFTDTNLFFTAAWPTNETIPDATLDLYGSTNLLDPRWLLLSSHPATTNPVLFAIERASLPWYAEPAQHVHDATCVSVTNIVISLLDGTTVYTNAFWSCETNRTSGERGFFRLGTRRDTDGDGLFDAWESLVAGTDPASPDTDGDGVPDGRTASEWLSHPLWAHNGDCTNLVIFLYEPITNGAAALRFDDLCIPLSTNAGPWCLCIPTNAVVDCALVSSPGTVVMLWYGPPEAAVATRSLVPGWNVPSGVPVPIWCDHPSDVFGGNDRGGGFCRFARPTLRVRSDESGQEDSGNICVHGSDGLVRFSWSVEPAACTGLWAYATGDLEPSCDDGSFSFDVSAAVPGEPGTRTGTLFVESEQSPFFGDNVLFGTLSATLSAHRCLGLLDNTYAYCLSCGVVHGNRTGSSSCYHEPWCATKSDLDADCDCAAPFVRIGDPSGFRLVGDPELVYCCHAHDAFPYGADLLSAPAGLGASVSNGVSLSVAPETRSPTIGGFVARYRILDGNGDAYRDLSLPFTCADLGIDPCLSDAQVPFEWEELAPEAYYLQDGTFYVARRAAPYSLRLWNESPSDARLVLSFASPTNGPTLRETPSGIRHSAFSITNGAPFAALNDDRAVYLDASCSNALATLSLTLSDPATDRTFLAESLAVKVVDTAVGEHWRVRSATDTLSWDFSDAPEDVYAYLWRPNADSTFGDLVGFTLDKTPSLSLDLPPGDYLLDFYFPRVYDGGSWAAWSTNTLHILDNPAIVSLDGCDSLNEAAHHTALYETNALVVRRAQSFRFKTTVTKWFDPARHELRFLLADDFSGTWITNEISESTATAPTTEWFFRNISSSTNPDESVELTTDVYCSTTNCPIGAYRFSVALFDRATGDRIDSKELETDLIVLFNPWSDKDSVYMPDENWRNECVLKTSGKMWIGTRNRKIEKRWSYNQFSQAPLSVVFLHLTQLSRSSRANPVRVARLFSWCVNSKGNPSGIVRGSWGTVFPNGTKPWEWQGTLPIMEAYLQSHMPVNYGQCFVFAGVLTSCMRCVGIPSRPVTNFESGHDEDKDGFVDQYMVSRNRMDRSRSDLIWNYHVWTECWMTRANESNGDDCWQILDGTPQEQSEGKYQCGPARRVAVKQQAAEPYDTLFVVGEVSGRVRTWRIKNNDWMLQKTSFGKYGKDISTKNISGMRLDITGKYKNP